MTHIYYLTLIVITGVGSSLMTMYYPHLKRVIKRYTAQIRKPENKTQHQLAIHESAIINLTQKIVELEKQIDNMAKSIHSDRGNLNTKIDKRIDNKLKQIIDEN